MHARNARDKPPLTQAIDLTGVASNGIRDSRIEGSLLIMQNFRSRRDKRRRQRDRRKRSRPTKLREQLRAWRRKHDLSQSEAGLKLQISKRTLQEWEQGRAMPRGLALVSLQQVILNAAIRDSRIASRVKRRSHLRPQPPDYGASRKPSLTRSEGKA